MGERDKRKGKVNQFVFGQERWGYLKPIINFQKRGDMLYLDGQSLAPFLFFQKGGGQSFFSFDKWVREKQVKDGNGCKMQDNILLQVLYVVVCL